MEQNRVEICDVTLREGEQCPGVNFSMEGKVRIAKELVCAGLRNIEIGVVGIDSDEEAYRELSNITDETKAQFSMTLLPHDHLFERCLNQSIQAVNIVVPTTDVLAEAFGSDIRVVQSKVKRWVNGFVNGQTQFRIVLADASRALFLRSDGRLKKNLQYAQKHLNEIAETVELFFSEGARDFIVADTLGIFAPSDIKLMMGFLNERFKTIRWGVHFHNDFGLASANTLAAFECGALLLQTTFNRLGERSGIATTAEVVAALKYLFGIDLDINIGKLRDIASKLESLTGVMLSERDPVVGKGLFWYETATPLLGMLKHGFPMFEMIPAGDVGEQRSVIIGKHTSRRTYDELRGRSIIPPGSNYDSLRQCAMMKRDAHVCAMEKIVEAYHNLSLASLTSFPVHSPNRRRKE